MSGFCGWFGGAHVDDPRILEVMARALPSYGPVRANATSGTRFGLALNGHPLASAFAADSELVVAIEGYPEWSDPRLREIARGEGNGRALLAAYRRDGSALLKLLRGTFSFAILDLSAEKAFCAIDRFGVQTLCYARPSPDLIVFGSTTDAVRAHPRVGATIAIQSIFDYLYFVDRVPAPETIYREQRKLAPAEYLLVEPGRTTVARYWEMPYRSAGRVDRTGAAAELRHRLREAVKASLDGVNGGAVGAFLSGGLDSSSVAGIAAELLPAKLQTFTIGFPVEGFDEARYAEIAASRFATKHQTYYIRPEDVVEVLLDAVRIYDEPFANSSVIPAYYCARLAKEAGVEVMLAGDGGDELFAGNSRYAADRIFDHYDRLPGVLQGLIEPATHHLGLARNRGFVGKVARYVEHAQKPVPERMAGNLFQTFDPRQVFAADALQNIDINAPRALSAEIYNAPREASKLQRMMYLDLRVTLADSDLRKVCRMCELAGVRLRFPFLHDALAEFSAQLPEALLMEGGKLRQFYKEAMRGFLPDAIIDKQKHGFGLPYVSFMNSYEPLRSLVCDSLVKLKKRGYFRVDFLDAVTGRAQRGSLSSQDGFAWDLALLELWLDSRGM